MTAPSRRRLVGPPGFPTAEYVTKLRHGGMVNSRFRREACRTNPILFSLVYLDHHLTSSETGGAYSLSEFHLLAAEEAKSWMRTDLAPAELRRAIATARGGGKSTWFFLILLLWSLAYGHRTFVVAFSDTGIMAKRHLLSLRAELAKNEKLRADFPELCTPATFGRRSVMDTQAGYLAASGAAVIVAGLDQGTLGIKLENRRPDLLILDDGEPPDSNYSDYQKEQRLSTLREAVLPMSLNAVVMLVGTTTRFGSIMHDALRGEAWAVEDNFQPRLIPALITDPVTGAERSSWPQRWPLEYLQGIAHTRSFAVNYQCEPMSADGTHWQPSDFVYDEKGLLAPHVIAKVLAIDPAVTSKKTSDQTGLAVVGYVGNVHKMLVEKATGVRYDPTRLRALVHKTLVDDPQIRHVVVEVTNGGEWIEQALEPLPNGLRLKSVRPSDSKLARITSLFDMYQRKEVVHAKRLQALEQQQLAFPGATDDIVDAVETAVRTLRAKYGVKR